MPSLGSRHANSVARCPPRVGGPKNWVHLPCHQPKWALKAQRGKAWHGCQNTIFLVKECGDSSRQSSNDHAISAALGGSLGQGAICTVQVVPNCRRVLIGPKWPKTGHFGCRASCVALAVLDGSDGRIHLLDCGHAIGCHACHDGTILEHVGELCRVVGAPSAPPTVVVRAAAAASISPAPAPAT